MEPAEVGPGLAASAELAALVPFARAAYRNTAAAAFAAALLVMGRLVLLVVQLMLDTRGSPYWPCPSACRYMPQQKLQTSHMVSRTARMTLAPIVHLQRRQLDGLVGQEGRRSQRIAKRTTTIQNLFPACLLHSPSKTTPRFVELRV